MIEGLRVSDIVVRAMVDGNQDRMSEILNQRQVAAMTMQIPYTTSAERAARHPASLEVAD